MELDSKDLLTEEELLALDELDSLYRDYGGEEG